MDLTSPRSAIRCTYVAWVNVSHRVLSSLLVTRAQAFDGIAWSELQGVISINVTAVNHPPEVFSSTQSGFADSYTVLTLAGQGI